MKKNHVVTVLFVTGVSIGAGYYFFTKPKHIELKQNLPPVEQPQVLSKDSQQALVMKNVMLHEGVKDNEYHYIIRAAQAGLDMQSNSQENLVICDGVDVTVLRDGVEVGQLHADTCRIDRVKKEGVLTGNLSGVLLNSQVKASRLVFDLTHDTIELQDVSSELVPADIDQLDSPSPNDSGN